jgi:cytochrome oxidase assembly protein ShyY1
MLRLAVTPRWIVAALVVLAFVALAIMLGRWQWDRTQTILAAERAAIAEPIPVQELFPDADATEVPVEGIGRPVRAEGDYEPDLQAAVTDRLHEGQAGVWIVTGLRLDDGRVVAVLRGSLPSATSPGATAPSGRVGVTGVLQPDEAFYADAASDPGAVASIAHDRLAEMWQADVLPGFVVLATQEPPDLPAPLPVAPTVQTADVPFPLQNFFYAFQWWVFAAFGIAVYLRWLWLESRRATPG